MDLEFEIEAQVAAGGVLRRTPAARRSAPGQAAGGQGQVLEGRFVRSCSSWWLPASPNVRAFRQVVAHGSGFR